MESTSLTSEFGLCEEKAGKVMRWMAESEDIAKSEFTVARVFEPGVLPENTKGFLQDLLQLQFPGDRTDLELPPEQLHALISNAFKNTYLYLVTPQLFLSDFFSFETDHLTLGSGLLTRLSYVVDYPYFPDLVLEWLAVQLEMGRTEIPKDEFRAFLSLADRAVLANSPHEKLIEYLKPLYEFHSDATILDWAIINLLLDDKHLEIPFRLENQDAFSIEETVSILKESMTFSPMKEPEEEIAPLPEYGEFLKELREIGVHIPSPSHKLTVENNSLPPMQLFISEKLRAKCLEKIFHENINEYERAISILNATSEYSQGELNLHTLLDIYKIPEDSKVARRLRKALRLRFNIPSPAIAE